MNRHTKIFALTVIAAVTIFAWGACADAKLTGFSGWKHSRWAGMGAIIAPTATNEAVSQTNTYARDDFLLHKDQYPWLTRNLLRSVRKEAALNRIPMPLVLAVIHAESTGHVRARGPAVKVRLSNGKRVWTRARGLMQLIPEFHAHRKGHLGKKGPRWNLYHPETNIRLGAAYLAQCIGWADGNWTTGLKNYNAGPRSNFYNWPYIKKILANYERSRRRLKSVQPASGQPSVVAAING